MPRNSTKKVLETQTSLASNIVETQTITTQKVQYKELPIHLKQAVGFDAVVIPVREYGACCYNSAALHIYKDSQHCLYLRKLAHDFMVQCWSYYRNWISLPFTETVGVGL